MSNNNNNRKLEKGEYAIPDHILTHLGNIINSYQGDQSIAGFVRSKKLYSAGKVSGFNLKRVKNFFDNVRLYYQRATSEKRKRYIRTAYKLTGGQLFEQWVNQILHDNRDTIDRLSKQDYKPSKPDENPTETPKPKIKSDIPKLHENIIKNIIQKILIEYKNHV